MSRSLHRLVWPLFGLFAAACPRADDASARKSDATPSAKAAAKADTKPDSKADTQPEAKPKLGRVLAGPLPITEMLGHTPAEVEAKLGDPLGKGERRGSCVRYVPERTWFECAHARQRYADPTGKFKAVGVEYEDGKASALSFEGLAGTGEFSPEAALAFVGLELPGQAQLEEPEPGAKVYAWFNASARLLIHDRQYRVQVSTVDGDWARSKVELILNDALSPDELARKVD